MSQNTILSSAEASDLTARLGASWFGHAFYDNANTRAVQVMQSGKNPDRIPVVLEQIRRSQQVLAPFAGRIVTGRTSSLVLCENNDWSEMQFPGSDSATASAAGVITGIEAHQVRQRFFDNRDRNLTEFEFSKSPHRATFGFYIGVVLSQLKSPPDFGKYHVDPTPTPDKVMIPIHDFKQYASGDSIAGHLE